MGVSGEIRGDLENYSSSTMKRALVYISHSSIFSQQHTFLLAAGPWFALPPPPTSPPRTPPPHDLHLLCQPLPLCPARRENSSHDRRLEDTCFNVQCVLYQGACRTIRKIGTEKEQVMSMGTVGNQITLCSWGSRQSAIIIIIKRSTKDN